MRWPRDSGADRLPRTCDRTSPRRAPARVANVGAVPGERPTSGVGTHPAILLSLLAHSQVSRTSSRTHLRLRVRPPRVLCCLLISETFGGLDAALASARVPPRGGLLHEGGDLLAGVVRTARGPDPHGVHPTLVQWRPTLVEWTNIVQTIKDTRPVAPHPRGVDTGRRAGSPSWCFGGEVGRVGRRRVRTLCLAFGGSRYEPATYPTNARRSPKGEPRGPRLRCSARTARRRSRAAPQGPWTRSHPRRRPASPPAHHATC